MNLDLNLFEMPKGIPVSVSDSVRVARAPNINEASFEQTGERVPLLVSESGCLKINFIFSLFLT